MYLTSFTAVFTLWKCPETEPAVFPGCVRIDTALCAAFPRSAFWSCLHAWDFSLIFVAA